MRKKYSSPSGHQHLQVSSIPDPQPLHSGPTITTPRTSVLITSRHITPHHITSHHRTSSLHTTLNPPSIARHPHNNSLTPYHKPPTHPTKPPKQASHPPPPKTAIPSTPPPAPPQPILFRTHPRTHPRGSPDASHAQRPDFQTPARIAARAGTFPAAGSERWQNYVSLVRFTYSRVGTGSRGRDGCRRAEEGSEKGNMCIAEPHGEMSGVALWVVGRGGREGMEGLD